MIGYIILALFLLVIALVLIRTLRFRPLPQASVSQSPANIDSEKAANDLSEMIRCKTVSHIDGTLEDEAEFEKFEKLLPRLFPKVFSVCEYEKLSSRALLFRWKGKAKGEPVILMAHFDVVPADDAEWEKPAFSGIIENGVIWGRGTLDTKSTLLSVLSAAEARISEGFVPEQDYYFCFGGNEEIMGDGAPSIVEELGRRGIKPCMVLDEGGAIVENVFPGVSKPCALIGIGEKGSWNVALSAKANGGHSSAPSAETPVDMLAKAVCKIHDHPFKFRITKSARELFNNIARHSSFAFRMIFANLWLFSPVLNLICKKQGGELNAMLRTTVAFTMAEGSNTPNVLPSSAYVVMNVRLLEGDTKKSALERFKKLVNNASVECLDIIGSDPSTSSPSDTRGYKAIERAINESYPGVIVSPYLMIACSDSRHYLKICENVYRFSGMPLSAEERLMIHGKNEQIPVEKLADTIRFYYRLMGILQN
jgi:carboxypeptidase PM20D1